MENAFSNGSGSPGLHHSFVFWAYSCLFHLSLARLLGCGTAKISSTVPPLVCGDLRRTKQVLFSSSLNFRPFAAIQVRPVLKDFTLDEEDARHPSTQDGLLAPVTFLHGNPSAFPCCVL